MVGVSKKRKLTPEIVEEEDDYVPSADDGDESVVDSGDEDEGDEEEEEEDEEDEEAEYIPPKTKVSKATKVKPAAAAVAARPAAAARKPPRVVKKAPKKQEEEEEEMEEEEVEEGKKPTAKKKTSVPPKKKPKAVVGVGEKLVPAKKSASADYEVQPNKSGKVVDMSVVGPRYSTDQVRLDERHWMQIQTTFMRSKGVTFDQVFIGRNPREGEVSKDGTPPKPWTMNVPVRCLEPMLRGCLVLMGLTSYQM
jgi:hypothetical protein